MKKVMAGTLRLGKDLKFYEYHRSGWKKSKRSIPTALEVAKYYRSFRKLGLLVDKKNSKFLKGQLNKDGSAVGARTNVLPNGEVLEKAFSLFSPFLKIHAQDKLDHWDVMYQNKGGTFSYVYTLTKRKEHRARKYGKVNHFEKKYDLLLRNVTKALRDKDDYMAPAMYTLLRTYIRVGNERYFKLHKHKGLCTLQHSNVIVKGSKVTFKFFGKDGVPIEITEKFPAAYVTRLKSLLKKKGFVFSRPNGKTLRESDFKGAFKKYCGEEFYPHIIRSYFATHTVKTFLRHHTTARKEDVMQLFLYIAHKLGHKKFNKKTSKWEDSSSVTVKSYIEPALVEKAKKLYEKK